MNVLLALAGVVLVVGGAVFLHRLDTRSRRAWEEREARDRRELLAARQRHLGAQMRVTGESLLSGKRYRPAHQYLAPARRTASHGNTIPFRSRKP